MVKIGLLVIITMFAPAGLVYSPAQPHINKPTPVAIIHKAPQSQISNDKPLAQSAIPVTGSTSSSHYTSNRAPTNIPDNQNAPSSTDVSNPLSTGTSDKYDGDCQPTATVGRCADKCPAPEFVRGFDKVTGAAVCGYVTGCPYGDSVALGADCYRNCTNENPDFATDPTVCYQGTGYSG